MTAHSSRRTEPHISGLQTRIPELLPLTLHKQRQKKFTLKNETSLNSVSSAAHRLVVNSKITKRVTSNILDLEIWPNAISKASGRPF